MTPATALYQLRHSPLMFLQNNLLTIEGDAVTGVRNMYLGKRTMQPNQVGASNEAFKISNNNNNIDQPLQMQMHNIRMIPNHEEIELFDLETYALAGGPDIMVTGQLTGCSFCIHNGAGVINVVHVQPGGRRGMAGEQLKVTLSMTGRFHGIAGRFTRVFGIGDYQLASGVSVIGVRRAGWEIYAQIATRALQNSQIQRVVRLL